MRAFMTVIAPMAELAIGWLWLERGILAAERLLTFWWWFTIASFTGVVMFIVLARLLLSHSIPVPKQGSISKIWARVVWVVRIVAQIVLGFPALATMSVITWVLCWLVLGVCTDDAKPEQEQVKDA